MQWQQFLSDQGAQWDGEQLVGFPSLPSFAAELPAFKAPLLDHQLLLVEGPEALKFLQGQLTCDLKQLPCEAPLLGAHCNAQGRMVSSFWIFQLAPETFAIRIPRSHIDKAQAALQKYIVFSRAKITVSNCVGILLSTPERQLIDEIKEPSEDAVYLRHKDGSIEFWGGEQNAAALWSKTSLAPAPPAAASLWQIRCGVPEVSPATSEQYLPQQFNFHLLDGINFKKGCYTGQEIVARIHYRGQVKKLTLAIGLPQDIEAPNPGTVLFDESGKKELGTIINSVKIEGAHEALFNTNPDNLNCELIGQMHNLPVKFTWRALPYAIPNE